MDWESLENGYWLAVNNDHRLGSDAVLLARFAAPVAANERVCDLGTGCGCIPFLLLGKTPSPTTIVGVDIQPDAIMLCHLSCEKNRRAPLVFLEADWRQPKTIGAAGSFGCVICNPPYFIAGSGKENPNPARRIARHETADTLPSLCAAAKYLLRYGGHFCLCHLPSQIPRVLAALQDNGLELKRLQLVQQRADSAPWLVLLDAVHGGRPGLSVSPPYLLENTDSQVSLAE